MIITKIEEQKKRPGRVNVYLDGEFAFGLTDKLVIDFDLYKGKELSDQEVAKIKGGEGIAKAMDKAYRYLSYRMRSEKEMRDKLAEKFEEPIISEAIRKLKEYNFINDLEFARVWVSSRKAGRSARALGYELKKKGIGPVDIEAAVSEMDKESEYSAALGLIKSKSKYQGLSRDEAYQKVGGFLSRRGYSYDIIKKVVADLTEK